MKKIFLIEGPPGSGKSSLCRALLKKRENLSFVDVDTIRVATSRKIGVPWRRRIAYEVALFWTEQLMRVGRDIVVELADTFEPWERKLSHLIDKYRYRHYRILLLPSLAFCAKRSMGRSIEAHTDITKIRNSYRFYLKKKKKAKEQYSLIIDSGKTSMRSKLASIKGLLELSEPDSDNG